MMDQQSNLHKHLSAAAINALMWRLVVWIDDKSASYIYVAI